ncbi:amidohydrolase family protein [Actinosynnema pretiosum]|uniref:Amidohydrolase n=1 Tax=Actinosynnema pretiosum TaxID=42197 RepID=A0A290ZCI7_9PSEU|nr:amidohydrolase family protein [Actinosynnema pretiosum]ATE56715.1 amidohydrolase [Actinosynnema pretiosum]
METPLAVVETTPLIDHHCHGVLGGELDRRAFEARLTEAPAAAPGTSLFDTAVGFAVRRWCAPVLDLPPHASPDAYLERRAELGADEVNRRFIGAAGVEVFLVDAGLPGELVDPSAFGGRSLDVLRLERLAELVVGEGAAGFLDRVRSALERSRSVAAKSIAAYRVGLDLDPARPSDAEVVRAASRWLASGSGRCADPVLSRFLVWEALERGLPVQFHAGYGDSDLDLHRADPALLTPLLRAVQPLGVPVLLLHNYPFHRTAGYLAQVFPHVCADLGLATHGVGDRAAAVLAEALELVPCGKFLYSSDACALAELHYLGALLFRRGLSEVLRGKLTSGALSDEDAVRITRMVSGGNARRVYRID